MYSKQREYSYFYRLVLLKALVSLAKSSLPEARALVESGELTSALMQVRLICGVCVCVCE